MHNELSGGVESRHAAESDAVGNDRIPTNPQGSVLDAEIGAGSEHIARKNTTKRGSSAPPAQSVVRLICEGGPQDGFTAERESCESLTFGQHADPRLAVYYRYRRTTDLDAATGRVVFEYAGCERVSMEANGLRRILLALRCLRPAQVEVGNLGAVGV
jgi:hypothetical protein